MFRRMINNMTYTIRPVRDVCMENRGISPEVQGGIITGIITSMYVWYLKESHARDLEIQKYEIRRQERERIK